MHSIFLADLATVLAQHGSSLLFQKGMVPPAALSDYWVSCRSRFDLWSQVFREAREAEVSEVPGRFHAWWSQSGGVLDEILISELLTRVYAGLGVVLDRRTGGEELAPVAHAIFMNHAEYRGRVLELLLRSMRVQPSEVQRLNRLREAVERWNDTLLASLALKNQEVQRYAFDLKRLKSHAEDAKQSISELGDAARVLQAATIHQAFEGLTRKEPTLPLANQRVARSVLLSLRPDLFDAVGPLKTLWMHRLQAGDGASFSRLGRTHGGQPRHSGNLGWLRADP